MIICEIGLNHMGDENYVKEYLKTIIHAKADGVLFHIREKSFYDQHPELELTDKIYQEISKILKKNKIKFGITLADPEKTEFCKKLNVDFYKIFSKDILYKELITNIISSKKRILVSTGMSDINEIKKFVNLIKNNKKQITLIHTQLDNSIEKVNLKAILLLKEKFKMNVGYGNHASNTYTIYASIAYEPSDILFYVKGEKVRRHIDDPHAVQLTDLKKFIKNINEIKKSIGKKTKIKMKANIK